MFGIFEISLGNKADDRDERFVTCKLPFLLNFKIKSGGAQNYYYYFFAGAFRLVWPKADQMKGFALGSFFVSAGF